jgi:hypothetical protein
MGGQYHRLVIFDRFRSSYYYNKSSEAHQDVARGRRRFVRPLIRHLRNAMPPLHAGNSDVVFDDDDVASRINAANLHALKHIMFPRDDTTSLGSLPGVCGSKSNPSSFVQSTKSTPRRIPILHPSRRPLDARVVSTPPPPRTPPPVQPAGADVTIPHR